MPRTKQTARKSTEGPPMQPATKAICKSIEPLKGVPLGILKANHDWEACFSSDDERESISPGCPSLATINEYEDCDPGPSTGTDSFDDTFHSAKESESPADTDNNATSIGSTSQSSSSTDDDDGPTSRKRSYFELQSDYEYRSYQSRYCTSLD
ncbi:MAG: hypothetical protein ACI90V_006041 [Bacillariaceae sp.]|jgi:hypothetical protein